MQKLLTKTVKDIISAVTLPSMQALTKLFLTVRKQNKQTTEKKRNRHTYTLTQTILLKGQGPVS